MLRSQILETTTQMRNTINPGLKSGVLECRDGVCTPTLGPEGSHPALKGEVSLSSIKRMDSLLSREFIRLKNGGLQGVRVQENALRPIDLDSGRQKHFLALLHPGWVVFLGFTLLLSGVLGCGYSLQSSRHSLLAAQGVRQIYVLPVTNATFKPGVETMVYNQLVRTVSASGKVRVTEDRDHADALLQGTVSAAVFSPIGGMSVSSMSPNVGVNLPTGEFQIPATYQATLSCSFGLSWVHPPQGRSATIWGAAYSRSDPFPAANQLDVPGTTSALINESEFERALADLAKKMMVDVNNGMLDMF